MNALLVLYGGDLSEQAFLPAFYGKNCIELAAEKAKTFPGVKKTVLLASRTDFSFLDNIEIEQKASWTKKSLLEKIAELQTGFDCIYFAFADCPFLDSALTQKMLDRHLQYHAEYSYADGLPYGLTPEILSPGTAGVLAKILGDDDGTVTRDILFSVIQKDINAFDIEVEISPVDLRCHRINLCADSKRNMMLLKNFFAAAGEKIPAASDVEQIIAEQPQILRTLPNFYPIQVYGGCPQACTFCPYPSVTNVSERRDFMTAENFTQLLDKITAFSGDAVIDLSLWGELSLHPEKMKLIEAVISRSELALVIETSGIGWKNDELEKCAELSANAGKRVNPRINPMAPLSWIVSLDAAEPQRYAEIRGNGFAEAVNCAKKLLTLFPNDCYVQAVRTTGAEEDIEKFYRYWKENAPRGEKNVIIQKYDDFCGYLENKQASDISPVIRQPCWHLMRDMPVLLNGNVPLCREDINVLKENKGKHLMGNAFSDPLETIWQNGEQNYLEQCKKNYSGLCRNCNEYYTYNF